MCPSYEAHLCFSFRGKIRHTKMLLEHEDIEELIKQKLHMVH